MKTYEAYLYNFGFSKTGFNTAQEALEYLISTVFEGCVYDEAGTMIVSYSPINGVHWNLTSEEGEC